jgi:hypothetical protein
MKAAGTRRQGTPRRAPAPTLSREPVPTARHDSRKAGRQKQPQVSWLLGFPVERGSGALPILTAPRELSRALAQFKGCANRASGGQYAHQPPAESCSWSTASARDVCALLCTPPALSGEAP